VENLVLSKQIIVQGRCRCCKCPILNIKLLVEHRNPAGVLSIKGRQTPPPPPLLSQQHTIKESTPLQENRGTQEADHCDGAGQKVDLNSIPLDSSGLEEKVLPLHRRGTPVYLESGLRSVASVTP